MKKEFSLNKWIDWRLNSDNKLNEDKFSIDGINFENIDSKNIRLIDKGVSILSWNTIAKLYKLGKDRGFIKEPVK